jgi:hypothetical protein
LSPTADEIGWASEQTRSESHLLALILSLKCFQRLGYFPTLEEVPEVVLHQLRRCLALKDDGGRRVPSALPRRTGRWCGHDSA